MGKNQWPRKRIREVPTDRPLGLGNNAPLQCALRCLSSVPFAVSLSFCLSVRSFKWPSNGLAPLTTGSRHENRILAQNTNMRAMNEPAGHIRRKQSFELSIPEYSWSLLPSSQSGGLLPLLPFAPCAFEASILGAARFLASSSPIPWHFPGSLSSRKRPFQV